MTRVTCIENSQEYTYVFRDYRSVDMKLRDRAGKFMADTKWNRLCVRCREHQDEIKIVALSAIITLAIYEVIIGLLG